MLFSLLFIPLSLDLLTQYYSVGGRALMIEPPQRSSLWRFHHKTLMNTADDLLNCGGFEVQWGKNGGKCGVCGDPWSQPQDHDDGGIYASGLIIRSFNQGGYVNVTVEVLNNLLGYFEFRLCPRNDTKQKLTHSCFENNVLWIEESWDTRYYPGSRGGIYDIHVRLPASVICSHCVFQWKFTTGYRMGGTNRCDCMGCGKQEQFYNCADIEIKQSDNVVTSIPRYLAVLGSVRTPSFLLSTENRSEAVMQPLQDHIPYSGSSIHVHNKSVTSGNTSDAISSMLSTDPGSILNSDKVKLEKLLFPLPKGSRIPATTFELLSMLNKTTTDTVPLHRVEITTKRNPTFIRFIAPSQEQNISDSVTPNAINISSIHMTPSGNRSTSINITSRLYPDTLQQTTVLPPFRVGFGKDSFRFNFPGFPLAAIRKLFPKMLNTSKQKRPVSHTRNIKTLFNLPQATVTISPFITTLHSPIVPKFDQKDMNGNGNRCNVNSKNFYCKGIGHHANTNGIDQWCTLNCRAGNCNVLKFICECSCEEMPSQRCHAIGSFALIPGMNAWCSFACIGNYCPPTICSVDDCRPKSGE